MSKHAFLSASASHRWLNCPPNAKLCESLLDQTSSYAQEGTESKASFDPYEKKLLGVTAMTALLGKKRFEELLGEPIYKPPGKPALVPESDKRPAMNNATDDFNDNIKEENDHE